LTPNLGYWATSFLAFQKNPILFFHPQGLLPEFALLTSLKAGLFADIRIEIGLGGQ
jgi:hypothetical protein